MSEEYTVFVRGRRFTLSRDQVEFDSPNFFTACFLSKEAKTRTIVLGRNPDLFAIIAEYLCGYEIFPLDDYTHKPAGLTPEKLLKNLMVDAKFYKLQKLARLLSPLFQHTDRVVGFLGAVGPPLPFGDLVKDQLPTGVEFSAQTGFTTLVDAKNLPILVRLFDTPITLSLIKEFKDQDVIFKCQLEVHLARSTIELLQSTNRVLERRHVDLEPTTRFTINGNTFSKHLLEEWYSLRSESSKTSLDIDLLDKIFPSEPFRDTEGWWAYDDTNRLEKPFRLFADEVLFAYGNPWRVFSIKARTSQLFIEEEVASGNGQFGVDSAHVNRSLLPTLVTSSKVDERPSSMRTKESPIHVHLHGDDGLRSAQNAVTASSTGGGISLTSLIETESVAIWRGSGDDEGDIRSKKRRIS